MLEFKLAGYAKFLILLFGILWTLSYACFYIIFSDVTILVPGIIIFIWGIYLLKVFIAFSKDTFKKIVIDNSSGKILLITAKKEVLAVPFEDIVAIQMAKGAVLKGIELGHVKIITREPKIYGITISKLDKFYVNLPKEIPLTLDDAILYHPKWNNIEY